MKFILLFLIFSIQGWSKWSVSSYNIRNFDKDYNAGPTNIAELSRLIKEVKSDVMAFQEVVNKNAFLELIKKNLPNYSYLLSSCGGFGKQHLALIYDPKKFEYITHSEDLSVSGGGEKCGNLRPALFVTLKNKDTGTKQTFGIVHLKAGSSTSAMEQRWQQYKRMETLSKNFLNHDLILLGDFNTTGYISENEDFKNFDGMTKNLNMRSTSENLNCTNYWEGLSDDNEYQSSILDHIIIQDKYHSKVESVKSLAHCSILECHSATLEELGLSFETVSDHCPIKVLFN